MNQYYPEKSKLKEQFQINAEVTGQSYDLLYWCWRPKRVGMQFQLEPEGLREEQPIA